MKEMEMVWGKEKGDGTNLEIDPSFVSSVPHSTPSNAINAHSIDHHTRKFTVLPPLRRRRHAGESEARAAEGEGEEGGEEEAVMVKACVCGVWI